MSVTLSGNVPQSIELVREYMIEKPTFSLGERFKLTTADKPTIYAFRPTGFLRLMLNLFVSFVVFVGLSVVTSFLAGRIQAHTLIGLLIGFDAIAAFIYMLWKWPRRNITFYADETHREPLWTIREDWPFLPDFARKFTVFISNLPTTIVNNSTDITQFGPAWSLSRADGGVVFRTRIPASNMILSAIAGESLEPLSYLFADADTNSLIGDLTPEFNIGLSTKYRLRVYHSGAPSADQTAAEGEQRSAQQNVVDERWLQSMAVLIDTGLKSQT